MLTACGDKNEIPVVDDPAEHLSVGCLTCENRFTITKYSRQKIQNHQKAFQLKADELIKRQRVGRFLHFMQYDELYLKNLSLDQSLNTEYLSFDSGIFTPLAANSREVLKPSENQLPGNLSSGTDYENGNLTNPIVRVVADQVKLSFNPPGEQSIVLTADHATLLTEHLIIKFAGHVSLVAKKCKIQADTVIWSGDHNGIFMSGYFQVNNKTFRKPAFFRITRNGVCKKNSTVKQVDYIDSLDIVEDRIFQMLPASAQILYGLLGTAN